MTINHPERIVPKEEVNRGVLTAHLKRYDFAVRYCDGKRVLDIGCGVGYGSLHLANKATMVIGVDNATEAVQYAQKNYSSLAADNQNNRQNHNPTRGAAGESGYYTEYVVKGVDAFFVMDAHELGFREESFDVVCCFEAIEHLRDPEGFLAEVVRVVRSDGLLLVSTPQVQGTVREESNPYHVTEFDRRRFKEMLSVFFGSVEIYGQRRHQTEPHYWMQKIDPFIMRGLLPEFIRKYAARILGSKAWHELELEDMLINQVAIERARELIGVCRSPKKGVC